VIEKARFSCFKAAGTQIFFPVRQPLRSLRAELPGAGQKIFTLVLPLLGCPARKTRIKILQESHLPFAAKPPEIGINWPIAGKGIIEMIRYGKSGVLRSKCENNVC
jgi:hypothetical protein